MGLGIFEAGGNEFKELENGFLCWLDSKLKKADHWSLRMNSWMLGTKDDMGASVWGAGMKFKPLSSKDKRAGVRMGEWWRLQTKELELDEEILFEVEWTVRFNNLNVVASEEVSD